MQLLIGETVYISPALPRVLLQELPNLCQVFGRQLDVATCLVFQSTFDISAAQRSRREKPEKETMIIVNSRGPRKWDDEVAVRANPRDAQLGNGDAFTLRNGR